MPAPVVKVELGLNLGQSDPFSFTLDSPTRGLLDNTEFTLGGDRFFDITDRLIGASVTRGKNQSLDRMKGMGKPSVVNNYNITVSGGVGSGATIGKAIVEQIKAYERTSGQVFAGV